MVSAYSKTITVGSNSTVTGGYEDDTYVLNKGFGKVTISDIGGFNDTIQFGPGISISDLLITASGNDLVITIKGTSDKLTLKNQVGVVLMNNTIENYKFADGTSLNYYTIQNLITFDGTAGNTTLKGIGKSNTFYGGSNDTIYGSTGGGDTIYGGTNDIINLGGAGLVYAASCDTINGGSYNDTYIFNQGTGKVTINDIGGMDTIQFGAGITKNNLAVTTSGNDLIISIKGTSDKLILKNQFGSSSLNTVIENYKFADGTSLSYFAIQNMVTIDGTAGNMLINGTGSNNIIYGGLNDTINGGAGYDTIYGGLNDIISNKGACTFYAASGDVINGGTYDDTYVFNQGAGQVTINDAGGYNDAIQFGAGITKNNLVVTTSGNDLIISIKGTSDKLIIKNQIGSIYNINLIENYKFTDGTTLSFYAIQSMATIDGTAGHMVVNGLGYDNIINGGPNDTINGGSGSVTVYGGINDVINTGGGSTIYTTSGDTINGGYNGDTYVFNKGSGQVIINDAGGYNDSIQFGAGITKNNLAITASGNDLIISISGTCDKLILKNQLGSTINPNLIETYKFSDGTSLSYYNLQTMAGVNFNSSTTSTSGSTSGTTTTTGNITVSGNALFTGAFNSDTYIFNLGSGHDTINDLGGFGDTIQFGAGITHSNLTITASGNDLILGIKGTSDQLTLKNQFNSTTYADLIETYKFSDGTSLGYYNLQNMVSIDGTAGNLTINGTGTNDKIYGGINDTINGGNGSDTITAASGDVINGGTGNDTYIFNQSAGKTMLTDAGGMDKIQIGTDVIKNNIAIFEDSQGKLYIDYGNTDNTSRITINNWNNVSNQIEKIQLGDNTYLSNVDVNKLIQSMTSFVTSKGITMTSIDNVKANTSLMNIVNTAWHS